ncbi:hypothetical protein GJ496_009352 [Pomphorhynchus laevis]|nr:hypothetical protein GJ496_009352 [Pomphorhynchus laevis]
MVADNKDFSEMVVIDDLNHNGNRKLVTNDFHTMLPQVIPTRIHDTSDFVTLDMECTYYGCGLRTYNSFVVSARRRNSGLKKEIDELQSRIDDSSLTNLDGVFLENFQNLDSSSPSRIVQEERLDLDSIQSARMLQEIGDFDLSFDVLQNSL